MKEIKKILENYDLDIKKVQKLEKGYASKKWVVTDGFGNTYILKEVTNQSIQRINFILSVQSKLDYYSPKIISTKSANLYCFFKNKIYYLSEFISNKDIIVNHKTIIDIGEFLSALHIQMQKITNLNSDFLKLEDNVSILKNYLKYHEDNMNIEYINIIKYKLSILEQIDSKNINFNNLSRQVIHGDFYIDNVLFDGKSYKIIDFDQCCFFYKEYELLRALFMTIINFDFSSDEIFKNLSEFIKGYYKNNKIKSPIDAYNLYLYIQANSLSSLKQDDYNNKEKREFAMKRFKILKFLNENREKILKVLEGDYV